MKSGQIIIGPPGAGKSTYCQAMHMFLTELKVNHLLINLDPASENTPYVADIDIQELINIDDAMAELDLGPNGALIYCMDFVLENIEWLTLKIKNLP